MKLILENNIHNLIYFSRNRKYSKFPWKKGDTTVLLHKKSPIERLKNKKKITSINYFLTAKLFYDFVMSVSNFSRLFLKQLGAFKRAKQLYNHYQKFSVSISNNDYIRYLGMSELSGRFQSRLCYLLYSKATFKMLSYSTNLTWILSMSIFFDVT